MLSKYSPEFVPFLRCGMSVVRYFSWHQPHLSRKCVLWLDDNQFSKWCSLCQFVVEAAFCENWLLLMLDALGKPACYEYKSRSLAEWIIQSPLAPLSLSLLLLWALSSAWQGQVPCKAAKATSAGFSISPNAGLAARKRYLLLCNKKKKFATTAVLSSSVCTYIQGCCKIVVKIIVKFAAKIVVKIAVFICLHLY